MVRKNKQKHIPMRMCLYSHKRMPKSELIRLVRVDSGEVHVDRKGKEKGRGANITGELEIFEAALKKGSIERALKLERKLKPEEKDSLLEEFKRTLEEKIFREGNKPVKIRVSKEKIENLAI